MSLVLDINKKIMFSQSMSFSNNRDKHAPRQATTSRRIQFEKQTKKVKLNAVRPLDCNVVEGTSEIEWFALTLNATRGPSKPEVKRACGHFGTKGTYLIGRGKSCPRFN